jgi:hypothetical protein
LTRDRLGDVVETRAVSDVAGDSVETTVLGRHGLLRGSYLDDPYFARRTGYALDDPLYRRSVYPLRTYDRGYLSPRHESVTKTTNGVETVETVEADNALGEHEVTQKVHNNVTGADQVVQTVSSPRGARIRSLSPTALGHSRILFDDLLDPRRRGLREDFLLDDMRASRRYNDRLSAGLNSRSLYLDDPAWRRPKTRVDELVPTRHYLDDPLARYAVSDYPSLYGGNYRYSALDYPLAGHYSRFAADPRLGLADRFAADPRLGLADPYYHNDYLARRTAYAHDDPLYRRSAYLHHADPLYRDIR